MVRLKWLGILVVLLIGVYPSFADDNAKIVGTWRLVSYAMETQTTGEREPIMGKNPSGYIIFTPEGRMMEIITGEGRKTPKTDQDRAALWNSMVAYTGMYRLEGDKCFTKGDVAWAPARIGEDRANFFRIDGDRLQLLSEWGSSMTRPEKGTVRMITTWERAK
jgi:Lipocalin-like domain